MKNNWIIILLLGVTILSSCAAGRKMSFNNLEVKADYTNLSSLLVAYQDQRQQVLSGEEKPTWCGHINSTAQISYNMQTESQKPVADEFSQDIVNSITKNGQSATMIFVGTKTPIDSVLNVFANRPEERLLLFTIKKWEANIIPLFSKIRYEVIAQFELNVFDRSGKILANAETGDTKTLEQGAVGNVKLLQDLANQTFREQMENLLNKESVKSSLKKSSTTMIDN